MWPLGGRLTRGIAVEQSAKEKIAKESGLEISKLQFLGVARTLFDTDPFNHGRGTDTLNLMYLAEGRGEVKLDELHKSPTWFTREEYEGGLRATLHPYVVELIDRALSPRT